VERILRSRLCASTPAQFGFIAGLEGQTDWLDSHKATIKRRLDYSMSRIREIDGIECEEPGGAFYLFVRLTKQDLFEDDRSFVLDLLHDKHVLVVHGSGFSPEFGKGHFRMVCLPEIEILSQAFDRIESFISERG